MTTTPDLGLAAQPVAILPLKQRLRLIELLEQESTRLEEHAAQLDRDLCTEERQYDVADDVPDFDEKCQRLNVAIADADVVDDLRRFFDGALVVMSRPAPTGDAFSALSQLLVTAWVDGVDVAELVVQAAVDAQRVVFAATEDWLTSHRSGSWEASLLTQMFESGGWDRR